jgi:hypothetical protein
MRELKKDTWPHKVTIKTGIGTDRPACDAAIWLDETIGIYNGRWNFIVRFTSVDFYFKDGKDAVFFTLRWL